MAESTRFESSSSKFKWTETMVSKLIKAIREYKTKMEYKNLDFSADKVKLYEALRVEMAKEYSDFFGPMEISPLPEDCEDETEKVDKNVYLEQERKKVKKGYSRVMEKVKDIRQRFSKAITSGRRSGSGKIVLEFYDELVKIWGGSPATEPLPFGVQSSNSSETSDTAGTFKK